MEVDVDDSKLSIRSFLFSRSRAALRRIRVASPWTRASLPHFSGVAEAEKKNSLDFVRTFIGSLVIPFAHGG